MLFGGARGGGKSDACLGDFALHAARYGRDAIGLLVRRELPQLDSLIARSKELFTPLGAVWREQARTWTFPNGAVLRCRPLERDDDAEKYQGQSYSRVYVEEVTNFSDPRAVDKLKATLRSVAGVPVGFRATGNPGGPGHHWVKRRYIDPAPAGFQIMRDEFGNTRVFIPARLNDNKILLAGDPGYASRLQLSGSASLVRAWLGGDWSAIEGAFFDCWSNGAHVIRPFPVPTHWLRFRALDWGSASPFSVGWWAVASEDHPREGRIIPRGALIRYREWYGATAENEGLKLTAEAVARGIIARECAEPIAYGVLDPSAFAADGGPSIAERMANVGVAFHRADNRRLAGWDVLRARLIGDGDGRPMMYVVSTCAALIRTLPALMHDAARPEDVDTNSEDHAADETRYAVMSRPWTQPRPRPPAPIKGLSQLSLDDLYRLDRNTGSRHRI